MNKRQSQEMKNNIENMISEKINNKKVVVSLGMKTIGLFVDLENKEMLPEAYDKIKDQFTGKMEKWDDDEDAWILISY